MQGKTASVTGLNMDLVLIAMNVKVNGCLQGRAASVTGLNMDLVLIAMIVKGNSCLPAVVQCLTVCNATCRAKQLP